jgi:hypothetical protein
MHIIKIEKVALLWLTLNLPRQKLFSVYLFHCWGGELTQSATTLLGHESDPREESNP